MNLAGRLAAAAAVLALAGEARAEDAPLGRAVPDQLGMQDAATPVMRDLIWLDSFILIIISAIVALVVLLLVFVGIRFHKSIHPEPRVFTHNAKLEVVWTALPVLILVVIAVPSLRLLVEQLVVPEADTTVKVTGNQWNWTYAYPGTEIEYTSYMIAQGAADADEALPDLEAAGYTRDYYALAADAPLVVPVGKVVHVLVTASDVLHSFAMPSFGIKIDAVPGRTNETWFEAEAIGSYYGQCSELCGKDHAYMPINIEVVSETDYAAFLADPNGFIQALADARRGAAGTDFASAQ